MRVGMHFSYITGAECQQVKQPAQHSRFRSHSELLAEPVHIQKFIAQVSVEALYIVDASAL